MNTSVTVCPYCGAKHARLLADHLGVVGWCQDCHRTWLAAPPRRQPPPPPRDTEGCRIAWVA